MIKLTEILHTIKEEKNKDLTPLDNWNIRHAEYLEDMGFKSNGNYHYSIEKPFIKVAHSKKNGFIVEDANKKQINTFKDFNEMTEFFARYDQKWEHAPYQDNEEDEKELQRQEPKKPNTIRSEEESIKKWEMNEDIDQSKKDDINQTITDAINSMGSHFFHVSVRFKNKDEAQYAAHIGQNFNPTVDWTTNTVTFRAK